MTSVTIHSMRCAVLTVLAGGCQIVFPLDPAPAVDAPLVASDADDARSDSNIDALQCPAGYTSLGGASKYRVDVNPQVWLDAVSICATDSASMHTHLVTLNTQQEVDLVLSLFSGAPVWIGFQDRVSEGAFLNTSAEEVAPPFPADNTLGAGAPPWGAGQPDDMDGDCVRLNAANAATDPRRLVDDECNGPTLQFICECDGFADVSSKYQ